jgi:hypothetical protein
MAQEKDSGFPFFEEDKQLPGLACPLLQGTTFAFS